MNRWLAALERRLGRFAIPNLTTFIVGGMGLAFLISRVQPDFVNMLALDMAQVKSGQAWRLFTYLFIPTTGSLFWILFALYWVWLVGSNLEAEWGTFKFNVYYFVGMVGTTIAAVLTSGVEGNSYLNLSLFLAFATVFPDYEIFLFFILRIRVKWLGLVAGGYLLLSVLTGDWTTRAAIIAAMANYFLFFSGHIGNLVRGQKLQAMQAARRSSFRPPAQPELGHRVCALCGAREDQDADIRVCTCEKCGGGPRALCLPCARNH